MFRIPTIILAIMVLLTFTATSSAFVEEWFDDESMWNPLSRIAANPDAIAELVSGHGIIWDRECYWMEKRAADTTEAGRYVFRTSSGSEGVWWIEELEEYTYGLCMNDDYACYVLYELDDYERWKYWAWADLESGDFQRKAAVWSSKISSENLDRFFQNCESGAYDSILPK